MSFFSFCVSVFRPFKINIILLGLTGIIWGIYNSFSPYLLKMIIDNLMQTNDLSQITFPAIGYLSLYLITCLNFRACDYIELKTLPLLKKSIAMNMFNYVKLHSYDFFQNNFSGSLSNKINDMVVNLESLVNYANHFFSVFISFIIAIIVLGTVHPVFSLVLTFWCILFMTISMILSKSIHTLSKNTSESYSAYAGALVDIISNISSVRLFSRFSFEENNLEKSVNTLVANDHILRFEILKMRLLQDLTLIIVLSSMFVFLVYLYHHHQVTVGDFALVLTLTNSIIQSLWWFANQINDIYKNLGKCHQAFSLIEAPHAISDNLNSTDLLVSDGKIEFKNVTFAYDHKTPIFSNLSLSIKPGSKVGIVGYSGCGKSTLINLLLRYYDIQSGEILIDGQNIREVKQDSLRSKISMIPQDISLFHRSLKENIAYGKIDATDVDIVQASQKAHCEEFIRDLPSMYETLVGERGVKLSGGQRQRISIARAFLENAPILVLDEATSSLDSVTEKYIQDSLHYAIQNRTTLIIAHRLSTLLEMDRILVIKNGTIVEDGTHQQLIEKKGHYAKMWSMQSQGFLPTEEKT